MTGMIVDAQGKPLAAVTVIIYHAGAKVGYSTFCPSCYVDCGKRVLTDARGAFKFDSLSPNLWFTVLAIRDGYIPQITKAIDPIKTTSVSIKLAIKVSPIALNGTIRGRVVQADGSPIAYAIVKPAGLVLTNGGSAYGDIPGLEPISVTNRVGQFELTYSKPAPRILIEVEAHAFAPKFVVMDTGPERHSLTLTDGGSVAGRIVCNGRPVPDAQIAIIAKNRGGFADDLRIIGSPYEVVRVGTDKQGRFTITNIPTAVDWYLYATMDSTATKGAVNPVEIHVSKDGEYVKAPDLIVKPGYHVRGVVIASDKKPIANGMRVFISSTTVSDSQIVSLAVDGHFEFTNLPRGSYTVNSSIKNYHEDTPRYGPKPFVVDHDIDDFTIMIYPNTHLN